MLISGHRELAVLKGRSGYRYAILLAGSDEAGQEGELAVELVRIGAPADPDRLLAKLSFVLDGTSDGCSIFVGGLQGASGGNAKADTIHATRDLRGLRPKAAVFLATQTVAEAIGCISIHAVSNAAHISHVKPPTFRRAFFADYDAFWTERKGVASGDLGFTFAISTASSNPNAAALVSLVKASFARPPGGNQLPSGIETRELVSAR